jgi:hypothetical protein
VAQHLLRLRPGHSCHDEAWPSSATACAEAANQRADGRTADIIAAPLVFGDRRGFTSQQRLRPSSNCSGLIEDLHSTGAEFADNRVPPPDEAARGQLLRMMASDAMRGAVERHYGVRLAFQNCHRAAVFRPDASAALAEFTSARSQLLNQSPELRNC